MTPKEEPYNTEKEDSPVEKIDTAPKEEIKEQTDGQMQGSVTEEETEVQASGEPTALQKALAPIEEALQRFANTRQRGWLLTMASVVVFVVTYMLILPAITLSNPVCGMVEHVHTAQCYAPITTYEGCGYTPIAPGSLERMNGFSGIVLHEHDQYCPPDCPLQEVVPHVHTDACYENQYQGTRMVENGLGETSLEEVYEPVLVCGKETFEPVMHVHDESCYDDEGNLTCLLPQVVSHQHVPVSPQDDALLPQVLEEGLFVEDVLLEELPLEEFPMEELLLEEQSLEGLPLEEELGEETLALDIPVASETAEPCFTQHTKGGELICPLEEHTHTPACYEDYVSLVEEGEPQGELSEGTLVETMTIEDPISIVEEDVLLKEEPVLEEEAIVQEAPSEVGEPAPQSPSVEILEAVVLEEEPAEEPILVEEGLVEEPILVEEEPILQTEDPVVENLIEEDLGEVVLGEELLALTGDLVEQEPKPFEEEPIVEILAVGVTEEDALVILLEETAPLEEEVSLVEEEMLLEEAAPPEEEVSLEEAAIPEEEVPLVEEVPLEEEAPLVEEALISLSPDPVVTIEQETEGTTEDSVVMVEERVEEESREIFLERITERIEVFQEMTTELIEISSEVTTELEGSPQMPSDPPEEEDPAFEGTRFLEFTSPDYTVRVTYTHQAHIPNGAYLTVREIPYGTDEYYAYLGDYEGSASFFDITIHDREGKEIQPEAPVSVEVIYASDVSGDVNVVHFSQEGGTEIGGEMDSGSSSITFSTDRF